MNKEFQLYVFEFEGIAEMFYQPTLNEDNHNKLPDDSGVVAALNKQAQKIAQDIEKEIARFFRSSASVQAEIRFYEGSIVIEGTILIMSWLGPIVLAAGKKAFETEFARVVEVATQRVLQQALRTFAPNAEPVRKIEVKPQAASVLQERETKTEAEPAGGRQEPNITQFLPILTVVNTILLVLLLLVQVRATLP